MAGVRIPPTKVQIHFPHLRQLVKLLESDDLYAEPWKASMEELAAYGEAQGIRHAPLRSGRTIAMFGHKVQAKAVPRYAVVKTAAVSPKGYSYPRRLNYDSQSKHHGWFDRAVEDTRRVWPSLLARAAEAIAARWARG